MRQMSKNSKIPKLSLRKLIIIGSPQSFDVWGIDLTWPLSISKGGKKFGVAIDTLPSGQISNHYQTFTIEKVLKFVIKNIIIGLPDKIISDIGTRFESEEFTRLHEKRNSKKLFVGNSPKNQWGDRGNK